MNITELTPEQRRELLQELSINEQRKRVARDEAIATYKKIVNDTVVESFPHIENLSAAICACKSFIRENFAAVIEMKNELFELKEGQQSHQFASDDGQLRIKIGYYVLDSYDDTVDAGIAKVMTYIDSCVTDARSQMMVDTIKKLLAKDAKGTIKASRVLQLQQMADKSGDEDFVEGVRIIRNAYRPVESKSYIRAEFRDDNGAWKTVPLGITEAE